MFNSAFSASPSLRAHNVAANWQQTKNSRPLGTITRGTTGQNRLRRADRWLYFHPQVSSLLRSYNSPLAIDVGYGSSPTTTLEWATWLRKINPYTRVVGLEIDPNRLCNSVDNVDFALGGFEMAGYRPNIARAFNVLRQYDVAEVPRAWQTMCQQITPGGFLLEGTCDELGRLASWILLNSNAQPLTLTLAWSASHVEKPSSLASRLPKILIHQNIAGYPINDLLQAADAAWQLCAPYAVYGPRQRWWHALKHLRQAGWLVEIPRRPPRDNLLTLPWEQVKANN